MQNCRIIFCFLSLANHLLAGEITPWQEEEEEEEVEVLDPSKNSLDEWEWSFGGNLEAVFWSTGTPPAGLVKESGDNLAPRLALTLDIRPNDYWYAHATLRADRGFDPLNNPNGILRFDEAFVRYRPLGDQRLNIQLGKSATVFGAWINEHDYFDDPFLTQPLPYSQIIGISPLNPNALGPDAILQRDLGVAPGVFETSKRLWTSTIWGQAYTTGLTIFGHIGDFDYGFEIKNQGLPSHPVTWDPNREEFENPSYTGRIGYRPNAAWAFGVSGSRGPYLETSAERFLPRGLDRGDLPYTYLGFDARWSHRNWIVSGEVIGGQFETLNAGDLRTLSYTVQARRKLIPGVWVATRFGQTWNNDAIGPTGEEVEWSPNLWRVGTAVGWQVTPDLLLKAEYNYTSFNTLAVDAQNLFGLGVNLRF